MASREAEAKTVEETADAVLTAGAEASRLADANIGDSSPTLLNPHHGVLPLESMSQKLSEPQFDAVPGHAAPSDPAAISGAQRMRSRGQRLVVPSVGNLSATTEDGTEMLRSSVSSTGPGEGLVIRKARVRTQRPLAYSAAPAAM